MRLRKRLEKVERGNPGHQGEVVLYFDEGESHEDCITRYKADGVKLAENILLSPRPCETSDEWIASVERAKARGEYDTDDLVV